MWVQRADQSHYADQREYSSSNPRKADRHAIELPAKATGYDQDANFTAGGSVRHGAQGSSSGNAHFQTHGTRGASIGDSSLNQTQIVQGLGQTGQKLNLRQSLLNQGGSKNQQVVKVNY